MAKALRIQVLTVTDPNIFIPPEWWRDLMPRSTNANRVALFAIFNALRESDRLAIEYAPSERTEVRVNERHALRGRDVDLMDAFLDNWIGDPISERVKDAPGDWNSAVR